MDDTDNQFKSKNTRQKPVAPKRKLDQDMEDLFNEFRMPALLSPIKDNKEEQAIIIKEILELHQAMIKGKHKIQDPKAVDNCYKEKDKRVKRKTDIPIPDIVNDKWVTGKLR